jgi:hypothetical protein
VPGITHADNTARIQTVNKQFNEKFYNLINEFYKITGIPMLLNTSFNCQEPIVETPEDAIKTFNRTALDILVINNYKVKKMSKLEEVLNIVFDKEITEIISNQEYIGMRLSGGIDSAFLCYLTMTKFPKKKIIPITMYNKIRPVAQHSVGKVREMLKKLNPNSTLVEPEIGWFDTTGFKPTQEQRDNFVKTGQKYNPKDIFQNKWFYEIFDKYDGKLNIFFSGETHNPPLDVQDKLLPWFREFPLNRNKKAGHILGRRIYKGIIRYEFKPWRNRTKKEIASWVKELGLFETLFPVTETCELEIPNYEVYIKKFGMKYKNVGVEPCRRCWPCREKWWAYGYYDFMTKEGGEPLPQPKR